MSRPHLHLVVPGPLDQPTGGYRYDARMVFELRRRGWGVEVHELAGRFPDADRRARESLAETLASLPDGARVVIDGLAMGGLPEEVNAERDRLRVVALVHHPLADETGLSPAAQDRFAALERDALAACRGTVVTSGFTAARLESYGVAARRVRTVPPGTEPASRAEGPATGEPPALLCVASVVPRKGHDVFVRALARIRDLEWHCTCAGSLDRAPRHAANVRNRARDTGLADRIRFTGSCSEAELEEHYRSSTLFVLASYFEGYGMALTEALARGLPVVATAGGAVPHTVPSDAGILLPPGDDEALAEALRLLLDGTRAAAERRSRMSSAAREHAVRLPDWEAAARVFADALLELTPERPSRADG